MKMKIKYAIVPVIYLDAPGRVLLARLSKYSGKRISAPTEIEMKIASPGRRKRRPVTALRCFSRYLYADELELVFGIHSTNGGIVIHCH